MNRQIASLIKKIRERGVFVFDLETTSLNYRNGSLEGLAIYIPGRKGVKSIRAWLPFVKGTMPSGSGVLDVEETFAQLREVFEDEDIMAILYNAKFDIPWVEAVDLPDKIKVKNRVACAMIAMYMSDETRRSYKLQDVARDLFDIKIVSYKEASDSQRRFSFGDKKELGEYSMDQVEATWRVFCHAIKSMRKQDSTGQLERLFWNLEMPVMKILMEMEETGVLVDPRPLWKLKETVSERQREIEESILDRVGWLPKFDDPHQVSRFVYGDEAEGGLGLDPGARKLLPAGHYSTKRDDLEVWGRKNTFVAGLLEWRSLDSLSSNYIARMTKASDSEKRIHPIFTQHRHPVGRMLSSQPISLTDMPKYPGVRRSVCSHYSGDEESKDLRFLDLDYNQLELRVLAELSCDERLVSVFSTRSCSCKAYSEHKRCRHVDIHTLVAERLDISRARAKAINYGIIYGMGPMLLAAKADLVTPQGGLQRKRAQKLIDAWYEFFEGVRLFFGRTRKAARRSNWIVRAESGRLRRLSRDVARYNSSQKRAEAGRQACHFAVSAYATDLVKKAMVTVARMRDRRALRDERWKRVRFVLQLHDQLLIQYPVGIESEVIRDVGRAAESAGNNLSVPIPVNMKTGLNWEELDDVEREAT